MTKGSKDGRFAAKVWLSPAVFSIVVADPATAVALKLTGEPAAPATFAEAVFPPETVSSVQIALARPSPLVTLAVGARAPEDDCQVTVTPAWGNPSEFTTTRSGSGSAMATVPLWLLPLAVGSADTVTAGAVGGGEGGVMSPVPPHARSHVTTKGVRPSRAGAQARARRLCTLCIVDAPVYAASCWGMHNGPSMLSGR
jgi:hypothetical protein